MQQFLLKTLLFGVCFFVLEKAFIFVRDAAPAYDYDRRLELVLEGKLNKDILVMGSSRGQDDVDIQLLKDSLGIPGVYNLSYGGSTPEYQVWVLKQLLAHNEPPELIIKLLDDDFELMHKDPQGNGKGFRVDRLYPVVKYESVREELVRQGVKNDWLSRLFILHQLNRSNLDFRSERKIDTLYGAQVPDKHNDKLEWKYTVGPVYHPEEEIREEITYLLEFQELCHDNGIDLIYATAPIFRETNPDWMARMRELAQPPTYFYAHDTEEEAYREAKNFADPSHLNTGGAEVYTRDIIEFIRTHDLVPDSQ